MVFFPKFQYTKFSTKFSMALCRFETVPVAVAVIVAVDIAGAATPELRHPCRSPCLETRKRHEGESCPSGRDPPPSARALVAHCWPRWPCSPLLPFAACRLPLAVPPALVAVAAAAAAMPLALAAVVAAVMALLQLPPQPVLQPLLPLRQPLLLRPPSPLPLVLRAACCAWRAARCKPRAACCVQQAALPR